MGRDETETYLTVPSFFRCPISLDVMKSPVSLCTGVTYDRASIQRWLDGGNNTCPATMQILRTKDFVPNLTLQRLIKSWSDSLGRHAGGSPPRGILTVEEVNESLRRLSLEKDDDEIRLENLSRIVRFAKDSDTNREFLWKRDDFAPMLVDIVAAVDGGTRATTKIKLGLLAIMILDTMFKGDNNERDRERLSNLMLTDGGGRCLTALLLAIQRGNLKTKIESVRVLEMISFDTKSKEIISERDGILTELIKSISSETDASLMEACLSFLITISTSKRVRSKLIAEKTITMIKDILLTETTSVAVTEKSLKLLETLSSKREGRSEICGGDAGGRCVEGVVRKLLKVSEKATEHAVTILWCLCYVFREDKRAEETVERCNGVTKLLVVIQSNCSPMVRQMAKDLIKVLKVNTSASALSAYETNTTHITPF
ncbi:U-box domain-containing protein 29 [Raphanus sativus]|uniref:U-box domain-containing protein n=1 Tax=Raphanus sativus TaxID=3726 RepID=A0A9W3DU88_RAPSA|nr:U-box domain-containing protein 29-like [Raphanus sativus]KAJ4897847.1 U-box domain-containing protein 29 [Raphanus sativus]